MVGVAVVEVSGLGGIRWWVREEVGSVRVGGCLVLGLGGGWYGWEVKGVVGVDGIRWWVVVWVGGGRGGRVGGIR